MHRAHRPVEPLYRLISVVVLLVILFYAVPGFAKKKKSKKLSSKKIQSLKIQSLNSPKTTIDVKDIPSFNKKVTEYLGIPYRRGGTTKKGIDCSGLTRRFYAEVFGLDLPHSSYQQSRLDILEKVPPDMDDFQPTDLLFFAGKNKRINHVAIYLGDGKFLNATRGKGVIISSLESHYWKKRLVATRRIKDSVLSKATNDAFPAKADHGQVFSDQEFALGYAAVADNTFGVNMEGFYASRLFSENPDQRARYSGFIDQGNDESQMAMESLKGVRAFAHIRPTDWLRITPSMSMIKASSGYEGVSRNWQSYRLELAVAPEKSGWSLALSALSLFNDSFLETPPMMANYDLELRLNYDISETMKFSLSSTWENQKLFGDSEPERLVGTPDVLLNLNFSF